MSKQPWSELRAENKAEQIFASILLQSIYYFKKKYPKRKIQGIYFTTDPGKIGNTLYEIRETMNLGIYFRATGIYPYCEDLDRAILEMVLCHYIHLANNEKNQEHYWFTTDNIKLFKFMSESIPDDIAKITFEKALKDWGFYCLFKN